jgi:excisionase family DNA binding protein
MKRMTVKQAAEIFFCGNVSEALIYKEIRLGRLPHVRLSSGKILLDADSLEQWWQEQLSKSVQPRQMETREYGILRKIAE